MGKKSDETLMQLSYLGPVGRLEFQKLNLNQTNSSPKESEMLSVLDLEVWHQRRYGEDEAGKGICESIPATFRLVGELAEIYHEKLLVGSWVFMVGEPTIDLLESETGDLISYNLVSKITVCGGSDSLETGVVNDAHRES